MKNVIPFLFVIGIISQSFSQTNLNIYDYKCFGGSNMDFVNSITPIGDSLIGVSGYTYSNDGDFQSAETSASGYVMFFDTLLNLRKKVIIGGNETEIVRKILPTPENTILVAYESNSDSDEYSSCYGDYDIYLKNFDYTTEWLSPYLRFGGSGPDRIYGLSAKNLGGYLLSGISKSTDGDFSQNFGGYDGILINLNPAYTKAWAKNYGGSNDDYILFAYQLQDGNIIFFGTSKSTDFYLSDNHGNYDVWVCKVNSMGEIMWSKCFGGNFEDYIFNVKKIDNDKFVLIGASNSTNGDFEFVVKDSNSQKIANFFGFLCLIDSNGDIISGISYGIPNENVYFMDANFINDSEYEIFGSVSDGYSYSNLVYTYFNVNNSYYPEYNNVFNWISTEYIYNSNLNGINYLSMSTNSADLPQFHGEIDIFLFKSRLQDVSYNLYNVFKKVNIYPNPVKDELFIENFYDYIGCEYYIYSISGKLVSSGIIVNEGYISTKNLLPGKYFLSIKKDKSCFKQNFIKI